MTHNLTLIAASTHGPLEHALVSQIAEKLPGAGEPDWLSPDEACDIAFKATDDASLEKTNDEIREALGEHAIDFAIQPAEDRRKKLLVADMDSTLIGQECIDELADFAGLKPKIAAITERAMRGEIAFEPALRERVGLLKDIEQDVLQRVFNERITLTPGARTLAKTMAAHGATAVIVSGGFTFFTERVADAAGFHFNHANVLETRDGLLTGTVAKPILGQQAKLDALRAYREKRLLEANETMAVGDGANDLAMIGEAGLGVAFHAKPIVAVKAAARVDHCDLTALLFMQGYRRENFVED